MKRNYWKIDGRQHMIYVLLLLAISLSKIVRRRVDTTLVRSYSEYGGGINVHFYTEAAWQLITLSTWVVTFSEKLMKSAVICNNSGMGPTGERNVCPAMTDVERQLSDPSLYASDLFHLAHPFALQNLIVALKHINALRSYIGSLPAGGDNPQMAQLVLVDTVDSCGINFGCLITLLEENLPTVKTFDRRFYVFCIVLSGLKYVQLKSVNEPSQPANLWARCCHILRN